jgi:hypothetical protein
MFWWVLILGVVAVFVVITVVENRRGSKGSAGSEDRHLNAPEKRGGGVYPTGGGGS